MVFQGRKHQEECVYIRMALTHTYKYTATLNSDRPPYTNARQVGQPASEAGWQQCSFLPKNELSIKWNMFCPESSDLCRRDYNNSNSTDETTTSWTLSGRDTNASGLQQRVSTFDRSIEQADIDVFAQSVKIILMCIFFSGRARPVSPHPLVSLGR